MENQHVIDQDRLGVIGRLVAFLATVSADVRYTCKMSSMAASAASPLTDRPI
jgi:hypothetical protein